MKINTILSVFLIVNVTVHVDCIPVGDPGNGYNLEILSKNNRNSLLTPLSGGFSEKLDFSPFYEAVVKNVVPALIAKHEKGSTPGKEITHQLGNTVTENLSKNLSDILNSKLGQELLIAYGRKKKPTLLENLYETIVEYFKWVGTASSNKAHEVREKGLVRTISDTFSNGSRTQGHISTSLPHDIHQELDTSNEKFAQKHSPETFLEPRGLLDGLGGGRGRYGGGYGSHYNSPGPWNTFLYKPYDPRYPYSTMPPFMGGGPVAYLGYFFSSIFYLIQEFFSSIFTGHPPVPPPRQRPSLLRRPPRYY